MRVTGNSGAWPSPYSALQSRRTESGPGWEKYLAFLKEHYAGDHPDVIPCAEAAARGWI